MAPRYIDFDEARAERRREPVVLHAYGRDFELPGNIPAGVLLDVVRIQDEQGPDSELSTGDSLGMLSRMLPQDVLDELLSHADFDMADLLQLLHMVMAVYTAPAGDGPGEQASPSGAARRKSSRAGA
jgi:hypothetical protein